MMYHRSKHYGRVSVVHPAGSSGLKISYSLPSLSLRRFVRFYWIVQVIDTAKAGKLAHISPSGYPELIFNFGEPVSIDLNSDRCPSAPAAMIAGQITAPITVSMKEYLSFLCVKLQPFSLKALFNIESSQFTNKATPISEILRYSVYEQLSEAADNEERIDIVEHFLKDLIKNNQGKVSQSTLSLVDHLRNKPYFDMKGLEDILGSSSRSIQRRIKEEIGIGPKMLYRISRFNKAYSHKKRDPGITLQDLAFNYGYYDQAHFINEFREFTGLSPLKYFKNENVYNSLFAGLP